MKKLLIIIVLTGLLSSGAESFKISEKEYENIDRVLEFGVHVFLNCLDKVKEATEKLVREDMLRTNRIAIQGHWNSFKETANKISVEERGKGVQDDLVVAARTLRRLVLYYKDDVKNMIHTLATEENAQLYQPVINIFRGTIERAKANEIWGTLTENYFPEAPSIQSEPLEFLCYLLSTNVMETIVVNVLKAGVELITEIKKIDLDQLSERVKTVLENVNEKFNEIYEIQKEKENDDLILTISTTAKVAVFYWDRYLNSTDTPLLETQYEDTARKFRDQKVAEKLHELLKPVMQSEIINDVLRLHFDFYKEFYQVAGWTTVILIYSDESRITRTLRTVFMSTVVQSYPIYERLDEMGVFSTMKRLYLRAVDIVVALAGTEEFQTFREEYFEKWKSFREELNRLADEERKKPNVIFPQVRAMRQMFLDSFEAFVNKVNADIDDDTIRFLSVNWADIRDVCIQKLLARGVLTQDQLDEAERIYVDDILGFFGKYEQLTEVMDKKKAEDTLKALLKLVMVGFTFIYAPLTRTWDFVAI